MPILTKEVEVRVNGKTVKYYENLGYKIPIKDNGKKTVYDFNKTFMVKVEDLQKRSEIKIDVLCDYCLKEVLTMTYDQYTKRTKNINKIACKNCSSQKSKEVSLLLYGVDNYAKTKECREKMESTVGEIYGVKNPSQSKEVREKRKQTCIERYGVKCNLQLETNKEKVRNTCLERYGFEYPAQNPEIKRKISETMYQDGVRKLSRQQLYLHYLYGGELNYPIQYYNADICLLDDKIVIEYDGSGHKLTVKMGFISQEKFNQKEIIRDNIIKREGYRQIRIISLKDKLPSDQVLLQMLNDAKQYFNTTSHTWINFDIDNSKMINAENKNNGGIDYNYGELHTVNSTKETV